MIFALNVERNRFTQTQHCAAYAQGNWINKFRAMKDQSKNEKERIPFLMILISDFLRLALIVPPHVEWNRFIGRILVRTPVSNPFVRLDRQHFYICLRTTIATTHRRIYFWFLSRLSSPLAHMCAPMLPALSLYPISRSDTFDVDRPRIHICMRRRFFPFSCM